MRCTERDRRAARPALLGLALLLAGCSHLERLEFWKKPAPVQKAAQPAPQIPVDVHGLPDEVAENVRLHVEVAKRPCDLAPAYLQRLGAQAHGETASALEAFGYYHARSEVNVTHDAACPRVTIDVTPGPRVTVASVHIAIDGAARGDKGFMRAIAKTPLRAGEGLDHARYAATKSRIQEAAVARGYLEGHFSQATLRIDVATNTAVADLRYASGPRYRLGEIRIHQIPVTVQETLVRRFLDYTPGEPYDAAIVTRFYTALIASEYFDTVAIRPLVSKPEHGTIPLDITLAPRQRYKYTAGLGASTDEGLRTRLNVTDRRVNTSGHRLSLQGQASFIAQLFSADYLIPREHPADEWLTLHGGVQRQTVDSFATTETQAGVSETRRRPWGFMETRFVNFDHQSFDIASRQQNSTLVVPGLRWKKSVADDPLYPRRAYALDFELRGASDYLGSTVSFARAALSTRAILGLPWDTRLLTRAEIGASWSGDFDTLPPSERFFAGGDNSIRGYGYQALGPRDPAGKVVGGSYLGVAGLELEKYFTDKWGVATFVDAGNAFGGGARAAGVKAGVGLGLRWRSPIGPARIDFAHPLDNDLLVRVHLRIGPDL